MPCPPHTAHHHRHYLRSIALVVAAFVILSWPSVAQTGADPVEFGPYSAHILPDGLGLRVPIASPTDLILRADHPWSMYCWVKLQDPINKPTIVAGLGDVSADFPRYLALKSGEVALWLGPDNSLSAPARVTPGQWHLLVASFDGARFQVSADGARPISGNLTLGSATPVIQLAPSDKSIATNAHFGGWIADFTVLRRALAAAELHEIQSRPPSFNLINFTEASQSWPVQTHGQAGYRAPQNPLTLPHSRAAFSPPVAKVRNPLRHTLTLTGPNEWGITDGWFLKEAPKDTASGEQISDSSFKPSEWLRATVPGTILTSMVDDGVFPDPDFGLNNLAIPESLNRQDYWYRTEFIAPGEMKGRHLELNFAGINYRAEIWLNATKLGTITGAFRRGTFDITTHLRAGQTNVLAVRISPPPHPGIPHEQSILGGPGENGGLMELDGPTFLATEGWDWIPAIRDRNSGIWQPVTIRATEQLTLGDAQIITRLPLPNTSKADVEIDVPVHNHTASPVSATIVAAFEGVTITKAVTLSQGESTVKLTSTEFRELSVEHPRLWWPNGYGSPELYHLKLSLQQGSSTSDTREIRFGIREITYELSLLDSTGHLRRIEYSPTTARSAQQRIVDNSHTGMRAIPNPDALRSDLPEEKRAAMHSWVASLLPDADSSAAVHPVSDTRAQPYLVLHVNGVRIAARGGNWGMDDSRKRVSRERLEPFFRLHRDANLNIIRNWLGQNTEETFYDLADEYGLMVWNDFWETTQDYNIETEDPALFLDNATDTIQHFRNHPSIIVWCGRNEGVPQPILNDGLDTLVRSLDGTRYYQPSSNQVNLQGSGPYSYKDPALYFSTLNHGFSVEAGTPSLSTLEALQASIAPEDQWPISDAWAYHDWHQSGNGDTALFMSEIQAEFGAPTSLKDFERKAQMLNYVDHRAIFEGMAASLWAPNSGRMLWMTQPAWPSNEWQILSSDYDTQASFYATKKACEPIHVQLNLATNRVNIVNTTTTPLQDLNVSAKVFSLDNRLLFSTTQKSSIAANAVDTGFILDLAPHLTQGMILVQLRLADSAGSILSDNLYWLGEKSSSYRELNRLPAISLHTKASGAVANGQSVVEVTLTNSGPAASLATKLTLLDSRTGQRILPAYYSDNYISILPGESKVIHIEYPSSAGSAATEVAVRGWNAVEQKISVTH